MSLLDERRQELERQNPGWEVWYVRCYIGGVVWCARPERCDDARQVLNADSPEHLGEMIAEVEGSDSQEDNL